MNAHAAIAYALVGLTLLGAAMCSSEGHAQSGNHGDGHAEMHPTYETWKDHRGFSCCNDADCRPTRAYLGDDGLWRAFADGHWMIVPKDRVLSIPSPDGRSHICAPVNGTLPYCFVPGDIRS
jgi:hypothetical protein